jgi:hypothetical protein
MGYSVPVLVGKCNVPSVELWNDESIFQGYKPEVQINCIVAIADSFAWGIELLFITL